MSLLLLLGGSSGADQSGSDTGSGADTGSLAASLTSSDIGAGADAGTLAAAASGTDTGSGADAGSLAAALTGTDTGAGADAGTLEASAAGSDTGAGADAATASAELVGSDTGAGVDSATLEVSLAGSDTGSGADTGAGTADYAGSDTGSGADSAAAPDVVLSGSDTGAGADAGAMTGGPPARITQETVEALVIPSDQRTRVTQESAEALVVPTNQQARVTQETAEVLVVSDNSAARVTQETLEALIVPTGQAVRATQSIVEVLFKPFKVEFTGRLGIDEAQFAQIFPGHPGGPVVFAEPPIVTLQGRADGKATARGYMRVIGDVLLEGESHGTAAPQGVEPTGFLTVPETGIPGEPFTPVTAIIRYDGLNITPDVEYKQSEFVASARPQPGTATIRVRRPTIDFAVGREVTCHLGERKLWGGFVMSVQYGYYFPAGVEAERFALLQCVDYNILQHRRILYDKDDGANLELTKFPPGTPDVDVIRHYAAAHTDLAGDGVNFAVGVENVGSPSTDDEISGSASWTFGEFLAHIRFNTGAVDYIDPDRRLIHTDVDTPNAPFGISDRPEAGEIGCANLEIDFDASQRRDDALVWGVGMGSVDPVFSRVTESEAGRLVSQVGKFLPSVWKQATADRIADTLVNGSPQNRRGGKDDRVSVRCTVWEPGLRVADKVPFRSAVYGFEDVIPIREMRLTFPTPSQPRFDLILSHEIDDPWNAFDNWFPDFNFDLPEIGDIEIPVLPDIDITLPPPITWVDPVGNPILIGHGPPLICLDGYFHPITDDPEDFMGWRVGMSMFGGTVPAGLPPPDHPSGYGAYLIDGDVGTGNSGVRWQTADAIVWYGPTPIGVGFVEITQGFGVEQPEKSRSGRLQLYVNPWPGTGYILAGDSGEQFAPQTGGPGPGSLRVDSNYMGPVVGVIVASAQPFYRFPGVFEVANPWVVNEARLVSYCATVGTLEEFNGTVQGGGSAVGVRPPVVVPIDTPEGEPESEDVYYRIRQSWLPGTLMVWADGLLLNPATYTENSVERWINLGPGFTGYVYVRFRPI